MNAIDPSLPALSPAPASTCPVDPGAFPSPELAALVQQFKDAIAAKPGSANQDAARAVDTGVSESFASGLSFPRDFDEREPEALTARHMASPFPARVERQPHNPTGPEIEWPVSPKHEPRGASGLIQATDGHTTPDPVHAADGPAEPLAQADVIEPQAPLAPSGFRQEPEPTAIGSEATVVPSEFPGGARVSWPRDDSHGNRRERASETLIAPLREDPPRNVPAAPPDDFRAPDETEISARLAPAPQIPATTISSGHSIEDSSQPLVPPSPSGQSTLQPSSPPTQHLVSPQLSTDTRLAPATSDLEQPVLHVSTPSRPALLRHEFAGYESAMPRQAPTAPLEAPRLNETRGTTPDARVPDSTDEESPLGVTMLQTLLSHSSSAPTSIEAAAAVAPAAPAPRLESVIAETVSRILVSDPLHDARREVRIEIAPDVLPDTEVRLWREEGRLHVEFISSASVADRGLRDALPNLGSTIQQRQAEQELPVVTLRVAQAGAGYQPGDGRSRQQYVPLAEPEENA